jgi:hypothetical protein
MELDLAMIGIDETNTKHHANHALRLKEFIGDFKELFVKKLSMRTLDLDELKTNIHTFLDEIGLDEIMLTMVITRIKMS